MKLKSLLLAATAGAMMAGAVMAQAPAGGPGAGGPGAGGPRGGMGMGGPIDRARAVQMLGFGDAALKLTDAQKAELDKIADAYVAEVNKVPMTQGQPPSQESMAARMKARETAATAAGKVLNAEQKKTWDAAQAQRGGPGGGMGRGGPGGPGGPGGGMGPGGGRPPGQ